MAFAAAAAAAALFLPLSQSLFSLSQFLSLSFSLSVLSSHCSQFSLAGAPRPMSQKYKSSFPFGVAIFMIGTYVSNLYSHFKREAGCLGIIGDRHVTTFTKRFESPTC
jgi:hypothetical protein